MNTDSSQMGTDVSRQKLVADLKVLAADSEELLRATASQTGDKIAAARERIQASLANTKTKLADAERALQDKTKQAAQATEEYVHEHPWRAVGIAAVLGLVMGILISRR
ncbi:MAG TPA: DUF883 family protein [Burkholderiales bacterium]|nr:DUF883 family protein [Burkholderiales bacterium]